MREQRQNLNRGQLNSCLGIFMISVLGLATTLFTPAAPTLAAARFTSPAPAGPCGDKSMRYVDCGNGTVTDTVTGLIWLKDPNCLPASNWDDAQKATVALKNGDCGLTDASSPGDWRLPTEKEWEATMEKAKELKCGGPAGPVLTNDAGTACVKAGPSSFTKVEADYYWSSTPLEGSPQAVIGDLDHGNLLKGNIINTLLVWPVRGGKR